jgi:hypothetical protein
MVSLSFDTASLFGAYVERRARVARSLYLDGRVGLAWTHGTSLEVAGATLDVAALMAIGSTVLVGGGLSGEAGSDPTRHEPEIGATFGAFAVVHANATRRLFLETRAGPMCLPCGLQKPEPGASREWFFELGVGAGIELDP